MSAAIRCCRRAAVAGGTRACRPTWRLFTLAALLLCRLGETLLEAITSASGASQGEAATYTDLMAASLPDASGCRSAAAAVAAAPTTCMP